MTPTADFTTIKDYLESLGNLHVDINKVVRWNLAELNGQMRTNNQESIMLIDAPQINSEASERNVHVHDCAFTILGKPGVSAPRIDDYEKQNEIIQHCQNICFEVASRIQVDSYKSEDASLKWLYAGLQKQSFQYFKVGPIFTNNLYGYRCQFEITTREVYTIDPLKWSDV